RARRAPRAPRSAACRAGRRSAGRRSSRSAPGRRGTRRCARPPSGRPSPRSRIRASGSRESPRAPRSPRRSAPPPSRPRAPAPPGARSARCPGLLALPLRAALRQERADALARVLRAEHGGEALLLGPDARVEIALVRHALDLLDRERRLPAELARPLSCGVEELVV